MHTWVDSYRLLTLGTTRFGHLQTFSAMKKGNRSHRPCRYCQKIYVAFLGRAIPAKPGRPEPKNQTDGGGGYGRYYIIFFQPAL